MAEKIGIFQGRAAKYNKYILRIVAVKSPIKEWDLAKEICQDMTKQKDLPEEWLNLNWYQITQKIYSVLIRKKGRLQDLERKWYIHKKNITDEGKTFGAWFPTSKTFFALCMLDPSFIEAAVKEPVWSNPDIIIKSLTRKVAKRTHNKLPIKVSRKQLRKGFKRFFEECFKSKESIEQLIQNLKNLINMGFQLDEMDEQGLLLMLYTTPLVKKAVESEKLFWGLS